MAKISVQKLSEEEKKDLNIPSECRGQGDWSVWECAPAKFDWQYDSVEKAYIYEGRVKIKTKSGDVEIKAGDFVTFPKNLSCTWEVTEKIRKVYKFE